MTVSVLSDPVAGDPPAVVRSARASSHPLFALLGRRVLAGLLTLLVVSVLVFVMTSVLPGNIGQVVLGKDATPGRIAALNQRLGLNRPLVDQYWHWLTGALHGDLGQSAVQLAQGATHAPVSALLGEHLVNSLTLAAIVTALLVPVAILFGTIAALRAGGFLDYLISYTALALGSLPEFVFGTILIFVFFTELNLLPPVALVAPGQSALAHPNALVLPVLTLLGASLAFCARQIRASLLETLHRDYVEMARLNGLPERRVVIRYAVRNALAPGVQTIAQAVQYLFGGVIVVEALFDYPGIGQLLVQAVQTHDVTEVQGIALVLAAGYIAINIVADILVMYLVPKLRTGGR